MTFDSCPGDDSDCKICPEKLRCKRYAILGAEEFEHEELDVLSRAAIDLAVANALKIQGVNESVHKLIKRVLDYEKD
jgi:hypothetical protein